ncbi:MAG: archease [Pirellulales bacterium]|nr:archease [Pirellulales bacterium]
MYETFDHTADLGIRVRAATLPELLSEAGRAFFSVMVGGLESVRPEQRIDLRIKGTEPENLFFDWLDELLYTFETQRVLLTRFEVEQDASGVAAVAWGEPFDPSRHELDLEIKAVTYHGLKVQADKDGWLAEVIVDL